jgi:CRISPR-associated protein Csx10
MLRSRRTESWQVRWGLPRPSILGWQAGSCIVYQVMSGEIKSQKLAEIEAKGIGDRRAEGYGQLCFNDPLLKTEKLSEFQRQNQSLSTTSEDAPLISKENPSFQYARTIEKAAWREAIQNKALAIASDPDRRKDILGIQIVGIESQQPMSQPPMSQLGGFRSVVRRLTRQEKDNPVTHWINAIQGVENRKEKWSEDSLNTIRRLVTDFQLVWQKLEFDQELMQNLTATVDGNTSLSSELWAEAVRTLIDALIRAHKRDWENVQPEEAD